MAAPDTIERAPTERLQFLDAVRGFALLLMIVNHTSRPQADDRPASPAGLRVVGAAG